MSTHDTLTGLLSHTSFHLAVKERAESERTFAVAMLDIDNFQEFNGAEGHFEGDKFLVWLRETIKQSLDPNKGELAARYGGDEFALILIEEQLADRMEKLRALVEEDSRPMTVSIGVAKFPRDASSVKELFKAADDALYVAKRGGRNLVAFSKSREERIVKPVITDEDNGSGAKRKPPPPELPGGGALRLPD